MNENLWLMVWWKCIYYDYSALLNCLNKLTFQVYNLGTGQGVSVAQLVACFEEVSGKKVSLYHH